MDEWKNHPEVIKDNQFLCLSLHMHAHRSPHTSARQHNRVLIAQNRVHKKIDGLEMFHNKGTA